MRFCVGGALFFGPSSFAGKCQFGMVFIFCGGRGVFRVAQYGRKVCWVFVQDSPARNADLCSEMDDTGVLPTA